MQRTWILALILTACVVNSTPPIPTGTITQDFQACCDISDPDCDPFGCDTSGGGGGGGGCIASTYDAQMINSATILAINYAASHGGGSPSQCGAWHTSLGNQASCNVVGTTATCAVNYTDCGLVLQQGCSSNGG